MAKWRALHADISTSGQVNKLTEFEQLLFTWMIPHADDWGVLTGDPMELKLKVMPGSARQNQDMTDALQHIEEVGLIWQYQPDGYGPLIQFCKWDDHQPIRKERRLPASKPLYSEGLPDNARQRQAKTGYTILDHTRQDIDKNRQEETRQEESITEISDSFSSQWQAIISELKNMHDRKAVEMYFNAATGIKEVSGSRIVIGIKAGDLFMVKRSFQAKLAEAIGVACPEWAERELILEALQ